MASNRFFCFSGHRQNLIVHIFVSVAEIAVQFVAQFLLVHLRFSIARFEIFEMHEFQAQPFAIRVRTGVATLSVLHQESGGLPSYRSAAFGPGISRDFSTI